jgi:hypothetical protein
VQQSLETFKKNINDAQNILELINLNKLCHASLILNQIPSEFDMTVSIKIIEVLKQLFELLCNTKKIDSVLKKVKRKNIYFKEQSQTSGCLTRSITILNA